MQLYEFELVKACDILTRELYKLKPGETLVITADTENDERVVNGVAGAAFSLGAKPMVIWLPTPITEGKMADPLLPQESLLGALKGADAWFPLNSKQILDSTPARIALKENKKLRHLELTGADVGTMVRCVGRVNYPDLKILLKEVADATKAAKRVRMTTPAGTDIEFENLPDSEVKIHDGYADEPGLHFMAGQVGWLPDRESINGIIVFDGSIVPPCDVLEEPVRVTMKAGEIVKIEGGAQAQEYELWLNRLDHPQMRKVAHATYGFLPGATMSGKIAEDERVWGCTVWGFGATRDEDAPSHNDGICLTTSVWLDDKPFTDKGEFLDKKLADLSKKVRII
jgi:leucyl aminopeptidase (aminopeptidase T)